MTEKLVVIGNGMAAGRTLEELIARDPSRFEITIFGAEPRVNYDRIMLSPVLSGEKTYEEIVIHGEDWYASNGITLQRGKKAVHVDREKKRVVADDGTGAEYDRLLLATGSDPFIVPVPGSDLPGVLTYRDLDDVNAMLDAAQCGKKNAVVIGGGLLGLEAAAGLKMRGMSVTVLHLMPTLMKRQLDPTAGYLLQKAIETRGITVITRANTHQVMGTDRVEGVRLDDGTEIPADIVVMAVGIRPNAALAKQAGLDVGRGLKVDDAMVTSDPNILAVGECVEHRGICYGLVAPLHEMAKVAAASLAGETAAYGGSVTSTKLKVTGIDLFSAGDFAEGDDRQEIVLRDAARGVYKRLVLRDDRIIGAALYGDTADGAWFFQMLKDGTDISAMRETLIFGPAYAGGAPLDPTAAVAALPDSAEICGCNGICKSKIVNAIEAQGLTSIDQVRMHTKASSSCGTCTGLVEKLLMLSLGDRYSPAAIMPMCRCTDLGHDEVRRLIVAKSLKSIPAVMQELEWKTSCGCNKCRPALNYYLLSTWPGEYVDDAQSRFINERAHANIQKDGTFSIVPRMWGGLTNPKELRAIADVVEKFNIPTVKVTGGQRIDLLGVRKADLPAAWRDLNAAGLVSGHAYGKALRTIKTCVGSEWCRFGTQASMSLGVRMEKYLWGSWTPHKVKMAVSGCPRNCAEATCKDFGVVCVDSGYELHVGGAAGLEVKQTQLLCNVATEEEVLEYCAAVVQLYREQARYLERIHKWLARVGIDSVREQVVDNAERRRELQARFDYAQRFLQHDPWAERAAGEEAGEFQPLARFGILEAAE
jgi:nitrite reductase (NADH) large subunit